MSKIVVYHQSNGCETGCCGHMVQWDSKMRYRLLEHPDDRGETPIEFAKRLVAQAFGEEHVADLDWHNCNVQETDTCGLWR